MNLTAFPGLELRERREELGFTVDEVFRKTRIPSEYITAIEESRLRALPAPSYVVGFLRSYCDFLGLDSARFVDTFRACARPAPNRFLGMTRAEPVVAPRWFGEAVAWIAICGIIALCWLAYSVVVQPPADPAKNRVQAGTIDLTLPAKNAIHSE